MKWWNLFTQTISIRSAVMKKTCFSTFIHGLFCRIGLQNWQLYRKSKIFRLFDSKLAFLDLKQMHLDGNTWNYAQNTGIFILRYDWNAMRANLKELIYCMTLSLCWLWNKKKTTTINANCRVVTLTTAVKYEDGKHLRRQSRSTAYVLLYYRLKFYHVWTKNKEMAILFRIVFDHPS